MIIIQGIVFIIGIALTLYIALWNLFILSGVDIILAIGDIINDKASDGVAMRIAWDIFKMIVASLVGWLIMVVTVVINAWIGKFR